MDIYQKSTKQTNRIQMIEKIMELISIIQDGSISIIKQDSTVIQINTNEKILLHSQDTLNSEADKNLKEERYE
jgi:hypothetical protein